MASDRFATVALLFTVGYEGSDVSSLIAVLTRAGVEEVVDVRLTPLSRKPGFSKTALARALAAEGIGYSHQRDLGCPKDIRLSYRETGDFATYARSYRRRVLVRAASTVKALARTASSRRVCLLCFEKEASRCHRSLVAQDTQEANGGAIAVEDLSVPSSGRTSRRR